MKKNPLLYLIIRSWVYSKEHRKKIVTYYLLFSVALVFSLLEPYVLGLMLNEFQGNSITFRTLATYLTLYGGLSLGSWIFHGPARVVELEVSFLTRASFRQKLFDALVRLPVRWHRNNLSGDSIDKLSKGASSLAEFLSYDFEFISILVKFMVTLVVLVTYMPLAGVVVFITLVLTGLFVLRIDKRLSQQYRTLNVLDNQVTSTMFDYLINVTTIITLRLEEKVSRHVASRMERGRLLNRANTIVNELKWFSTSMMLNAMTVVVLGAYGFHELGAGRTLMVGSFFTLFEYLRAVSKEFGMFTWKYGSLVRQASEVEAAETILTAYEVERAEQATLAFPISWHRIAVERVQFIYDDEKSMSHHIKDVSVVLERGRSIAFVGESGSGKSTFLRLLRGLYSPQAGQVSVDGAVVEGGLGTLASRATLIPQDPEIFADTVLFNITLGMEASLEKVEEAVQAAQFRTVLSRLPKGLETNIAEKGINLSGGEKQRLALARGLYFAKESDIILLDEPTSSVDVANERLIYEHLLSFTKAKKCVVSSIHKLHLLELFDEIYVFHQGEVAEHGSLEELMKRQGIFWQMMKSYRTQVA